MSSDSISASRGIFFEPSRNGEIATPPNAPLPEVPKAGESFSAPHATAHLDIDASRGAEALNDR